MSAKTTSIRRTTMGYKPRRQAGRPTASDAHMRRLVEIDTLLSSKRALVCLAHSGADIPHFLFYLSSACDAIDWLVNALRKNQEART